MFDRREVLYGASLAIQEGWNLPIRFSNAEIPNYFFSAVYHVAFLSAQAQSLIIARILNGLFLSATAVIFFVLLGKYLRTSEAFLAATGLTLSYFGVFSIYFMPESLFFFLFWLTVYLYVFVDSPSVLVKAAGIGVLTALLALTKPHGLAVAAGWAAVLFLAPGSSYSTNFRSRLASAVVFGLVFTFSWFTVSYVITGTIQTDPVGDMYRGYIKPLIYSDSIISTVKVAFRHIGYLAFFSAFPLFTVAATCRKLPPEVATSVARLLLAGTFFSAVLIAICAKFTVDIAAMYPSMSLSRSHLRYYLVSLPLLVIPFFLCVKYYLDELQSRERLLWAVFFGLYVLGVFVVWANRHGSYFVDAPLLLFAGDRFALCLAVTMGVLAFGLAALGRKRYAVAAWVIFFFFTGLSSYYLGLKFLWTVDLGRLPKMAALIKECLPGKTVDKDVLFIYEVRDARPYILQYHLGATVKWHRVADTAREVDCSLVSPYQIVVTFRNLDVGCDFDVLAKDGDTTVLRSSKGPPLHDSHKSARVSGLLWDTRCVLSGWQEQEAAPTYVLGRRLKFNQDEVEPNLGRGWSAKEPGGRWTDGTEAELLFRLNQPVTSDLQLVIDGQGMVTEKHQQRLIIRVNGQTVAQMTLSHQSPSPRPVTIPRTLVDETGILKVTISTPDAITPKELGINKDTRRLALAVKAVVIQSVGQANQ